jgi:DNA ligase-associated metallophosphoesterase
MEFICQGEVLQLLPEKAVYWGRERVLLVADLHLGKTAAYRSAGLAIPGGGEDVDLARLGRLVETTGAKEVIVLGDLLHARSGRTKEVGRAFMAWREARMDLRMALVMGNHDLSAGAPPSEWRIEIWPESLVRGVFSFVHEAVPCAAGYAVGGHVHPAIAFSDGRRGNFRLPCFHFGEACAILPAFGSFTGTHALGSDTTGKIFAIAEERIFEIPPELRAGNRRGGGRRRIAKTPKKEDESTARPR